MTGHVIGSRPRALVITRNFPPLIGGMERLLYHAVRELSRDFDLAVVGPEGCGEHLDPGTPVLTCPVLPPAHFLVHCQWKAIRMAIRFRPHLIVSGSGVTAPASIGAGLPAKAPVVCFLHGLDLIAPHPLYQLAFLPAIQRCDTTIVNSRNTGRLAEAKGIQGKRVVVLHPGVQLPDPARSSDGEKLRSVVGGVRKPLLLSVGRLTERKGIVEFIDRCLPRIVGAHPDVLYVIIGGEPLHALTGSTGMVARIRNAASRKGLSRNVLVVENADDETLESAYWSSDLLIFPGIERTHDVEGFGMVVVEAAAHGLPTVAFAVGGVVDAVGDGRSGYLVGPGDYDGMEGAILNHLGASTPGVSARTCTDFASSFSWDNFGRKLRNVCRAARREFNQGR